MNDIQNVGLLINDRGNQFKVYWTRNSNRIWVTGNGIRYKACFKISLEQRGWVEGTDLGYHRVSSAENAMKIARSWWVLNKHKRPFCW